MQNTIKIQRVFYFDVVNALSTVYSGWENMRSYRNILLSCFFYYCCGPRPPRATHAVEAHAMSQPQTPLETKERRKMDEYHLIIFDIWNSSNRCEKWKECRRWWRRRRMDVVWRNSSIGCVEAKCWRQRQQQKKVVGCIMNEVILSFIASRNHNISQPL